MTMKRVLLWVMVLCLFTTSAFAKETGLDAAKLAKLMDGEDHRYKVSIGVPGEGNNYEYVLVIDASESVESHNWGNTLDIIRAFGNVVLSKDSTYHGMTLISFGMTSNAVIRYDTRDDLQRLEHISAEDVLYGVSSTNCEGALTYAYEYVEKMNKLGNSYLIFISDGETNTSEEPIIWQNLLDDSPDSLKWHMGKMSTQAIAVNNVFPSLVSWHQATGGDFDPATEWVMGQYKVDLASIGREDLVAKTYPYTNRRTGVHNENTPLWEIWVDSLWAQVYQEAGYPYNNTFATSIDKASRAFIEYDIRHYSSDGTANSLMTTWLLLYLMYGGVKYFVDNTGPNAGQPGNNKIAYNGERASLMVNKLLEEGVDVSLFRFKSRRYDESTNWMNPINGKISLKQDDYYNYSNYGDIAAEIHDLVFHVTSMDAYDAFVTDYTSKWVNFVPGSIKIYDDKEGKLIWSEESGWLISNPPVSGSPVIVERVNAADYAHGGPDVEGNTSGDIYKITWRIKDGVLLSTDHYRLEYEVLVDMEEKGIQPNTAYPANGNTEIVHHLSDGTPVRKAISVPEVQVEAQLPPTGDGAVPGLWLGMALLSLLSMVVIRKRKRA